MLYAITDDVTQCILCKCGVCPIEYFTVNFTVTSVGVRQLCLRRIGVHSQKSLKTVVVYFNFKPSMVELRLGLRAMLNIDVVSPISKR